MWLEDALKVVSQAHSELFLGSKGETRRAPPSARDAAVTSLDVHPAHPTSSRVRHNPFETRVGAANAADRLGRHLGARSAERGGVGGRATASRFAHRFHPYATADRGAGAASAFKTPAPHARAAFGFAGDGDGPRGVGFADPLQSSFLAEPGDTAPPRFATYTAWRGADGVGERHRNARASETALRAGVPATAPARRRSLFAPRAPPVRTAGGLLSSRGEPAADLTFEESALRTREMAHRARVLDSNNGSRRDDFDASNDMGGAPASPANASASFYAHGPRPFDPQARASPGAPSAETLELAEHRHDVAGSLARLTASIADRAAAETKQTASLDAKARFRPGYAAAAARAAREGRTLSSGKDVGTTFPPEGEASGEKKGAVPKDGNGRPVSVSSILFDAEALAAYRARVEKSRRKDVTKNASVVSVGPSSDPSPSDVSSLPSSDQKAKSAKSALSPLQTRGVEVEAAASRAARDGDPAFKAREDEVSRLIEEMSVRAEALEKRRPSALTPAEEAEEDDVAALEAALTAPLTAEQEAAVDAALAPGPSHEVLASGTFAWQGDLSFTRKDVATMAPNQWLNDEMINFTVGAMAAREAKRQVDVGKDGSTQSQPKTHFMSTFFTKKLCGGEAYDYNAVRRWTTKKKLGYDALLCDTIIVPVHQGIHWVLATVELREKRVRLYDSLLGEDHFLLDCLKRWVRDEYENKKGEAVDTSGWAAEHPKEIPRQMNGCDCGVFMLKYADYIASGCPLTFTQADMAYFRRRIVADGLEAGRGGGE